MKREHLTGLLCPGNQLLFPRVGLSVESKEYIKIARQESGCSMDLTYSIISLDCFLNLVIEACCELVSQ